MFDRTGHSTDDTLQGVEQRLTQTEDATIIRVEHDQGASVFDVNLSMEFHERGDAQDRPGRPIERWRAWVCSSPPAVIALDGM